MRVILDVNRPSSLSYDVQYCNTPEGFMELKKSHPEDDFEVDMGSYHVYCDYVADLYIREMLSFCGEMEITFEMLDAMMIWNSCAAHVMAPVYEEEDIARHNI